MEKVIESLVCATTVKFLFAHVSKLIHSCTRTAYIVPSIRATVQSIVVVVLIRLHMILDAVNNEAAILNAIRVTT
jgi:hypothetical protein